MYGGLRSDEPYCNYVQFLEDFVSDLEAGFDGQKVIA